MVVVVVIIVTSKGCILMVRQIYIKSVYVVETIGEKRGYKIVHPKTTTSIHSLKYASLDDALGRVGQAIKTLPIEEKKK